MKICFFIILLHFCGAAIADDGERSGAGQESPKEGDTIWLEERISPTTRWLDDLVKPLTVWMEQQINEPDPNLGNSETVPRVLEGPNIEEEDLGKKVDAGSFISSEQASQIAKAYIEGDVLYIKLLTSNYYRVKLISKVGEIHILYIKATTGEIFSKNESSVEEAIPAQDNQSDAASGNEAKEMP